MTEQIIRIMEYEKMLDQANELMKRKSLSSDNETLLRELIDKLKAYYESETWRKDFEDDENGLIPKDLKRGVLSEDGLYDLIDDYLQYKCERKGSFQYQAVFDQHHFTLHDCRVTSINYENRCLTFEIPGGIYCKKYGNNWPNTGKAAVKWKITGEDEAYLQVFIREDGKIIRYEYDLEDIMNNVNSGKWQLELGYRYRGLGAIIYIGYIWLEEEPWHYQMQLMVASRENEILFWNDPDK